MELKSFLLSKFGVDPIHRVLMFLPRFLLVPSKTRCIQVDRLRETPNHPAQRKTAEDPWLDIKKQTNPQFNMSASHHRT